MSWGLCRSSEPRERQLPRAPWVLSSWHPEGAPFIASSRVRDPSAMVSQFFWRLGIPLAVLWYLGAVAISIISPGVGMLGRNDDLLLLLVIGPIGSAVLALLGGALGFVFAGLSLGVSRLKAKRRLKRWRS